ncbi:hypothetical protein N0V88_004663 [Collariella sp. IMI 366227]|nr:hypothetical protein N0V88_004663 [Collariella sp. IMI 366227]
MAAAEKGNTQSSKSPNPLSSQTAQNDESTVGEARLEYKSQLTGQEEAEETLSEWEDEYGFVLVDIARLLFDLGRQNGGKKYLEKAIEIAKTGDPHEFHIWCWEDEPGQQSGNANLAYWLNHYKQVGELPPNVREKWKKVKHPMNNGI